jgi:molecular chaperone DnaK (HSP70)
MAIIGIDLGTSNPATAVLRGVRRVVFHGTERSGIERIYIGSNAFSSYVAITAGRHVQAGEPARCQAMDYLERIARAFKHGMGRRGNYRPRDKLVDAEYKENK